MIKEIAHFLATNNFGKFSEKGTDNSIFIAEFQDKPDSAICVYESAGQSPMNKKRAMARISRPNLQICCRDIYAFKAQEKLKEIVMLLDQKEDLKIDSLLFKLIRAKQNPFFMRMDKNNRYIYAVNFDTYIQKIEEQEE